MSRRTNYIRPANNEINRQQTEATKITAALKVNAQAVLDALPEIAEPTIPKTHESGEDEAYANRSKYFKTRKQVSEFVGLLSQLEEKHHPHLFHEGLRIARSARLLDTALRDLYIDISGPPSFIASLPEVAAVVNKDDSGRLAVRNAIHSFAEQYESFLGEYKEEGQSR